MVLPDNLYDALKAHSTRLGGLLFGIADITRFRDRIALSEAEMCGMNRAVSIGIPLSRQVLEGITDHPTLLYKWHYRQANILLDRIAFDLTQIIMQWGGRAIPIPASQITDWEKQTAHLSHRAVAEQAGGVKLHKMGSSPRSRSGWRSPPAVFSGPTKRPGIRPRTPARFPRS